METTTQPSAAYYTHDEVRALLAEEVYKRLALERQVAALTSRVKTLEKMNARGAAQITTDSIGIKVAADRDYDRQFPLLYPAPKPAPLL